MSARSSRIQIDREIHSIPQPRSISRKREESRDALLAQIHSLEGHLNDVIDERDVALAAVTYWKREAKRLAQIIATHR